GIQTAAASKRYVRALERLKDTLEGLPGLLTVRKRMPHACRGCYSGWHEVAWLGCRTGAPTAPCRRARTRRIPDRGRCGHPRRPSQDRLPLGRCFPRAGNRRPFGGCVARPTPETHQHPREDRAPLALRRPHRAWFPDLTLDCRPTAPTHRAG